MDRQTQSQEQPVPVQILCRNGCGFYGHPNFDGMCSKCFKDSLAQKDKTPTSLQENSIESPGKFRQPTLKVNDSSSEIKNKELDEIGLATNISKQEKVSELKEEKDEISSTNSDTDSPSKSNKRNRCFTCRKKVGLTGFLCHCGNVFCSTHRYSDKHECSFDYKAAGRAAISKNNPVVVGSKIQKI